MQASRTSRERYKVADFWDSEFRMRALFGFYERWV
jgi:hypothetical protein